MSRVGKLLRFAPTAVMVLLGLLWLVSTIAEVGFDVKRFGMSVLQGTAALCVQEGNDPRGSPPIWKCRPYDTGPNFSFGIFRHLAFDMTTFTNHYYEVPISFLMLLLLLPFAVGCSTRFRFRLWMYFVGVALVAICVMNWRIE